MSKKHKCTTATCAKVSTTIGIVKVCICGLIQLPKGKQVEQLTNADIHLVATLRR